MARRNQPPAHGLRPVYANNNEQVAVNRSTTPIHNPFNDRYIINGCPTHSKYFRWVDETQFYKDTATSQWYCEECGILYTDEQIADVLQRDGIRQDLDVLQWPIKYSWAGDCPHNGGFSFKCPKCGSPKTSYGTITNTTIPTLSSTMMRWFCTRCAAIFDMMDVPEFWSIQQTDLERAALESAWDEEARLEELFGEADDDQLPSG